MPEFVSFPKIPRLYRDISIREKIDGTNAQILIVPLVDTLHDLDSPVATVGDRGIWAGSRNRWLTLEQDNYGFAAWVQAHAQALVTLGEGRHFGEWWGQGIQRGYSLGHKVFSLFHAPGYAHPEGVVVWHTAASKSFKITLDNDAAKG